VVIDEAYIDYVYGSSFPSGIDFSRLHGNVVSLRTFSKVYGLASLRIGYAAANPELISALGRAKTPASVNAAAQAAAFAALSDEEHYKYVVDSNARERERYYKALEELNIEYIPTQCNFIMLNIGIDAVQAEAEFLRHGILVRKGTEFGYPTWLRITIGTASENSKVFEIIRDLANNSKA
jgi:histidinol-phosphate aminotransferase